MTDAERIDGLEGQAAFQERTVQQLSDALVQQQRRIDALEAKLAQIMANRTGEGDHLRADEKPPHY